MKINAAGRHFLQDGFSNQLPNSSIWKSSYPYRALVSEDDTEESIFSGVYEIYEYDRTQNLYKIRKPSEPNIPYTRIAFVSVPVEAEDYVAMGMASMSEPRWVTYDTEDEYEDPVCGDFLGTDADNYKLKKYRFGFECLAYDSDNELVLVRPQLLMPTVVKATAAESDGEVPVKFCDYLGNVLGDEFILKVLSCDGSPASSSSSSTSSEPPLGSSSSA